MRRLLLLLSVSVLALIALPTTAGAQGADIYGVGAGSVNFGGNVKFIKFQLSGHTGPQGDFGQFRFTIEDPNAPVDFRVDADCVRVSPFPPGAGGYIGGPVTKVTPQPNVYGIAPGDQMMLAFNDFGEPSDPIPDEVNAFFAAPQLCKTTPLFHQIPIDQGNINIKLG